MSFEILIEHDWDKASKLIGYMILAISNIEEDFMSNDILEPPEKKT